MTHRQAAGCIIYTSDQNGILYYLVLQYAAGHWDFAKGHTESYESLLQTAQREVLEETGLIIEVNNYFNYSYDYEFFTSSQQLIHKKVHLFLGHSFNKSIKLSNEHTAYVWLTLDQALEWLTYLNAQQALKAAHHFLCC